jgi:hypothetical protein
MIMKENVSIKNVFKSVWCGVWCMCVFVERNKSSTIYEYVKNI